MRFPPSLPSFLLSSLSPPFLPSSISRFLSVFPGNIPVSCIKHLLKKQEDIKLDHERFKAQSNSPMILKEGRNKQGQILVYMLASNWFSSLCDVLFLLSWRSFYCWYLVISSVTIIDISAWDYHITSTCGSCVTIKALLIKYQKEYTESYWSFQCPLPCPFLQIRVWLFYSEIQR